MEEQIKANVEQLLLPILENLKTKGGPTDKGYIDLLEENLKRITSSFGVNISSTKRGLTQREIELCGMIKKGIPSREMARLLNLSVRTIDARRNKIRKKLGIRKNEINLGAFLKYL